MSAIQIHTLDAIKGLEDTLSQGLAADPDKAKRLVLDRLQQLNKGTRSQLEHSATAHRQSSAIRGRKISSNGLSMENSSFTVSPIYRVALMHYGHWRAGETS